MKLLYDVSMMYICCKIHKFYRSCASYHMTTWPKSHDFENVWLFHNIHCTKCFSSFFYLGYFLSAFCWSLLIIIKVSRHLGNSLMRHITSMLSQCWLSGHWLWLAVLLSFADLICFKFCAFYLNCSKSLYILSWFIQHEVWPVTCDRLLAEFVHQLNWVVRLSKNKNSDKLRKWMWNSQVPLLHNMAVIFSTFTWLNFNRICQLNSLFIWYCFKFHN